MVDIREKFAPFESRMRAEGLPKIFIDSFENYYEQLVCGSTGLIPEESIIAVDKVPDMNSFPESLNEIGNKALKKTAVVKLNGGLGTSMGLEKAKSLLQVRDGYSFLDIIAQQVIQMQVPLVLMNSYVTEQDSLDALEPYPELNNELPSSFLQHKELKIDRSDLKPVDWPRVR